MRFHWPSFLIGYGAGVGSAALSRRFRPLMLEVATTLYRTFDSLAAQLVMRREDLEDLLAEARARARAVVEPHPQPTTESVH
jgi:hypothetical protein